MQINFCIMAGVNGELQNARDRAGDYPGAKECAAKTPLQRMKSK